MTTKYPEIPKKTFADYGQMLHGFWPNKPTFTEKDYPEFEGKVIIVTGGNTGVGYETVKSLAGSTKAKIYIFSRNEEKTLKAIKDIELEVAKEYKLKPNPIGFIQTDLSDLTTIKPAVEKFLNKESRLDLIIHNAGVMTPPTGSKSKQGYELQLGTNVLGPFLLQRLLDPIFIKTAKTNPPGVSRIVWVASTAHQVAPKGGIFWEDKNFENIPISSTIRMQIYGQSKAADILLAKAWTRHHPNVKDDVISTSVCPGYLKTELSRHSSWFESFILNRVTWPRRFGAYTELYAAFSPDVKDGDYSISFGVPAHTREDLNSVESGDKLWNWCEKETDPYV
ncbi:uncharacterized protein KGF55_000759 [Candida pseudojiufengensis]|uniref:uncharacterized protein n=1 Tax=Candida pseudojiufengensis TaxID=497109 RepID=UPI0022246F56|nr:uncharacterized protein KGF55_000759 [Candida pseudojiufengensis]KAI5966450.1 hypothetical protein KGF55_000759 [Candida pseudojiufengensis]